MPVTQTDDGKYECPKCHEKLDTPRALSNHIVKTHKMATRAFYYEYVKTPTEGTCAVCGTPTKYRDLMVGYKTTCSHKCGSILLKNDAEKMALKKAHTEASEISFRVVTRIFRKRIALSKADIRTNFPECRQRRICFRASPVSGIGLHSRSWISKA